MSIWRRIAATMTLWVSYAGGVLLAQSSLVVYDKTSGETLPNAHVCFESLDRTETSYTLTGPDGRITDLPDETSIISISFVGYETLIDTLHPGQAMKLYLNPSSFGMDEVVVTAQFSPVKIDQSIYKVRTINNSIVEKKGATNLSELISNELNFSPVRDAALGTSVRIQGLGGEHVKVLVDGVPMVGRQNGILDLSQINVASIDHIEIVEGPMSVVYGSNAMAGVINIITKENNRKCLNTGVDAYYESVGVYDLDATVSYNKGRHNAGLTAGRYFFSGYSEIDTSRAKEWNPKLQYNAQGYYAFTTGRFKGKFTSNYFDEELRDNGNLNPDLNYEGAFDYYHFTHRWENKMDLRQQIGEKQLLNISAAYSTYRKSKISYLNDLVNLEKKIIPQESANDTTTFRNWFSRGTYSNEELEKLTFQAGYEVTYESAESKRLDEVKSIGELAGYLSLNYTPWIRLSLQPGMRYIHNLTYDAPIVYSMNIKWDPWKQLQLRASYAKGFRAPSVKELYLDFQDINHNILGNPDLRAETGNNLNGWTDLNFGSEKHSFTWSNNVYYNRINDKIELLYDPDDPTAAVYFNVPAGAVISKGFSSELTYRLHPRLVFNTGVFHNALSSIVNTSEFTSSTDIASSVKYKNMKYRFELAVFYKYTDRYNRYSGSIDMETGEIMDVQLSYLDDYHNMDATLTVPLMKNRLRLTTGVKNIFNNKSITSSGGGAIHSGGGSGNTLLNWGRTWFVRASYQFNHFFN